MPVSNKTEACHNTVIESEGTDSIEDGWSVH